MQIKHPLTMGLILLIRFGSRIWLRLQENEST